MSYPFSSMRIDVWADLVCPWCYLGKRRLERALADFARRDEVDVVYRSFQLDPGLPRGTSFDQLPILMRKYRLGEDEARSRQRRLEQMAVEDGVELRLQGGHTGNTFDAHRLVHLAHDRDLEDAVVERFFAAQFTEQRSLFDAQALITLAAEAGLDPDEASHVVRTDMYADAVHADRRAAEALGADGVPFFVFDNRFAVAGAQPVEVLAGVLTRLVAGADDAATAQR